jgi:predicted nucleic acid-binding protein
MKLILDTSVVAKVFLIETNRDEALSLFRAAINGGVSLLAPSLLLYELNNALIRNGIKGSSYDQAIGALMAWVDNHVLVIREASEGLMRQAEAIASIDTQGLGHISSFDATFHALAIAEDGIFVTNDWSHVAKTRNLIGRVQTLGEAAAIVSAP